MNLTKQKHKKEQNQLSDTSKRKPLQIEQKIRKIKPQTAALLKTQYS